MEVCLYLLWGAWQDFQSKRIRNSYLLTGGIVGVVARIVGIFQGKHSYVEWLFALFPGIALLVIAAVTKEKIGMGDGWTILILGNYLSVVEIYYIFETALVMVIIFCAIKLWKKKINKEWEIPFLPFLWGAYTVLWGMGYV